MNKTEYLIEIESYARQFNVPVILGAARELLEQTVMESMPHRILEIGTAIGYSGSVMLLAAGNDCQLDTIELDDKRVEIARNNFNNLGLSERAHMYKGDAADILPELCMSNKYDYVLLDGPKAQYSSHFDIIFPAMNVGAVMLADNVLFRGMVIGGNPVAPRYRTIVKRLRQFIDKIKNDDRLTVEIIERADGVALITKISE